MKKITLLFLFVHSISISFSQNFSLEWAKNFGNIGINDVAVDAAGNVYIAGIFIGTADFDPGIGVFNMTSGPQDVFILKLDVNGNFVWAKNFAGASAGNSAEAMDLALDAAGNIYTTGNFNGTIDFDPDIGVVNLVSLGSGDIFISKLDALGNFVWVQQVGGLTTVDNDGGVGIEIDGAGDVYITGHFSGTADFDPGTSVSNLISNGDQDIFILKLNSGGNFAWAVNFGDTGYDIGNDIVVDAAGNVHTTGLFGGTVDFDPGGAAAYPLSSGGVANVFISKLDANGNFIWARNTDGTAESLALDGSGNVYTVGWFSGVNKDFDPGIGTYFLNATGNSETFLFKLDISGNFVWARSTSSTTPNNGATGYAVAIDDNLGYVYISGQFTGTNDFNTGIGADYLTSEGSTDVFVSKLDTSGNFIETKRMGGSATDYCNSAEVDNLGNFYTGGAFVSGIDADPTTAVYNLLAGGLSCFALKWKNCTSTTLTSAITDASDPYMNDGQVTVATNGNAPYTFLWDAQANNQTTATATALYPKEYCVTVTNSSWVAGCPPDTNVHCVTVGARAAFWRNDRYVRYNNFQGNVPSINHPIQARFSVFDALTSDTLWCNTYEKITNDYGSFNFRLGYEFDAPNPISTTCVNPPNITNVGFNPFDSCASASSQFVVGTNNVSSDFPYRGYWHDGRVQILYLASDLTAAGLSAGLIHSLAFNVVTQASTQPYSNFSIKMDTTSLNQFVATQSFLPNLAPVYYNPALTTSLGWNNYNFNTAFQWDGISNLVVEVCFDNNGFTLDDSVQAEMTSYPSTLEFENDNTIGCNEVSERAGVNRPLIRFSNCSIVATDKDFFNLPWATGNKWLRVQYEDTIGNGFPYSWNMELASHFYALTSSYAERIPHWHFESKHTIAHNGNANIYGSMGTYVQNTPSDLRYKKDITNIPNAWASLASIRGVKYQYQPEAFEKGKQPSTDTQIGLIAQEVEKAYPEMVQTNSNGYKTVDYTKLTPILLEAIKERQVRIEKMQADNAARRAIIEELKKLNASTNSILEKIPNTRAENK